MKYNIDVSKRCMTVKPFDGNVLDTFDDLLTFVITAQNFGCVKLDFLGEQFKIGQNLNKVKINGKEWSMTVNNDHEIPISKLVAQGVVANVKIINGVDVYSTLTKEQLKEIIKRDGIVHVYRINTAKVEELTKIAYLVIQDDFYTLLSKKTPFNPIDNSITIDNITYHKIDEECVVI